MTDHLHICHLPPFEPGRSGEDVEINCAYKSRVFIGRCLLFECKNIWVQILSQHGQLEKRITLSECIAIFKVR